MIATALVAIVSPGRAQPGPGVAAAESSETARAAASRMVEEASARFEAGDYRPRWNSTTARARRTPDPCRFSARLVPW
jgi:hypothetical protein